MIVLIAGATGGFGSVLGRYLAEQGVRVYGTSRGGSDSQGPLPFPVLEMDISDPESVRTCLGHIIEKEGRLDVVVNCVNEMFIGCIEEQTMEEVRGLYETNVVGAFGLAREVVPIMRRQGSGTIVSMSSLGGLLAVPTMSAYTSAKFALEAMSEALHHEVRGSGIDVVIMQPVAMAMDRPATGAHLRTVAGAGPDSPTFRMVRRMEKDTKASKLTPEMVAERVYEVITSKKKPLRVPMDRAKPLSIVKRLAPQVVIDRLIGGLLAELRPDAR